MSTEQDNPDLPRQSPDVQHLDSIRTHLQHQVTTLQAHLDTLQSQLAALQAALAGSPTSVSQPPLPNPQPSPASLRPPTRLMTGDAASQTRTLLLANGIDGISGQPLLTIDEGAANQLAYAAPDQPDLRALHQVRRAYTSQGHLGLVFGFSEDRLDESRWAIVVHASEPVAILKVLTPLIQHRSAQQGIELPALAFERDETCGAWYARMINTSNPTTPWNRRPPILLYQPGETCTQWLARHGVAPEPVDPRRGVPFYLLIAARPGPLFATDTTFIPFSFQYELDMFWGVGRLCFTDSHGQHALTDYAAYAEQVVAFEQAAPPYRKEMAFFATRHDLDLSTQRSADELILPLAQGHSGAPGIAARSGFAQQLVSGPQATRDALAAILSAPQSSPGQPERNRPALLFTATHGIGLPADDPRLPMHQGALLCQDWTGFGNIKREHWFAGEDLPAQAQVSGLIIVCFACYGAGCPQRDDFVFDVGDNQGIPGGTSVSRPIIAPYPLVAQLPQRLLARGALALLGHIDRAWTYAFSSATLPAQSQAFEDLLARILAGKRMGFATDQFNQRQGFVASLLANEIEYAQFGKRSDPQEVSALWVARNDARNYALLGDPAVCLPVDRMG